MQFISAHLQDGLRTHTTPLGLICPTAAAIRVKHIDAQEEYKGPPTHDQNDTRQRSSYPANAWNRFEFIWLSLARCARSIATLARSLAMLALSNHILLLSNTSHVTQPN